MEHRCIPCPVDLILECVQGQTSQSWLEDGAQYCDYSPALSFHCKGSVALQLTREAHFTDAAAHRASVTERHCSIFLVPLEHSCTVFAALLCSIEQLHGGLLVRLDKKQFG